MQVTVRGPSATSARPRVRRRRAPLSLWLVLLLAVLFLAVVASLAIGTRDLPMGSVLEALFRDDGSEASAIVRDLRLPRTALAVVVGLALGLAGALMQALTRNPLADPGILGVNAGAAVAVAFAISLLGIGSLIGYVWFSFVGAAVASVVVYLIGSAGHGGASPVRLALAGTAITAALQSIALGLVLLDPNSFSRYRFWSVGAVAGREIGVFWQILPFILVGTVLALALARPLNAVALGDETAGAIGANLTRTRILCAVAIVLLCGSATAAIGPIAFVGLVIPHVARAITGPDQRWVFAYSAVLGPLFLVLADVLGRVVVRPSELETGIMTALIGAPFFIALVRRRQLVAL